MGASDVQRSRHGTHLEPSVGSLQDSKGNVRFFWAGDVERLFEDLVLHRLAAEQAFEVTNPLLQLANAGRADDILVGLNGGTATFQHPTLPGKELRG